MRKHQRCDVDTSMSTISLAVSLLGLSEQGKRSVFCCGLVTPPVVYPVTQEIYFVGVSTVLLKRIDGWLFIRLANDLSEISRLLGVISQQYSAS